MIATERDISAWVVEAEMPTEIRARQHRLSAGRLTLKTGEIAVVYTVNGVMVESVAVDQWPQPSLSDVNTFFDPQEIGDDELAQDEVQRLRLATSPPARPKRLPLR